MGVTMSECKVQGRWCRLKLRRLAILQVWKQHTPKRETVLFLPEAGANPGPDRAAMGPGGLFVGAR